MKSSPALTNLLAKISHGWQILRSTPGLGGRLSAFCILLAGAARNPARLFLPAPAAGGVQGVALAAASSRDDGFFRALSHPVGIHQYELLKEKFKPIPIIVDPSRPRTVNFLLPTIDRRILFGGYHAAFRFIEALQRRSHHVRLVVTEPTVSPEKAVLESFAGDAFMTRVLSACEILLVTQRGRPLAFRSDDRLIAYSWDTARMAHDIAKRLNGLPHLYFIQEYEAIFNAHDSIGFLIKDTYSLPHFAIFNSGLLQEFFRRQRLGVFQDGTAAGDKNSVAYQHALCAVRHPSREEMAARTTRKLLAYARPEAHAGRNLFEITMMAINRAIEKGVFDGRQWEFHGMGTLALKGGYRLSGGRTMQMMPRMDIEEYRAVLGEHDLGVCLMFAPHPSVPPFEMAAAGMVTVTTAYENRPAAVMAGICCNLIAAEHSIDSIVAALEQAVARVEDFDDRIRGASFGQTCDWSESFDEAFLDRLALFEGPETA